LEIEPVLTLLKLLQSFVRALHSDGTPQQVAAGFALGAALGLTPLMSLHNLLVIAAIFLLRVSVPGAILGWLIMLPLGFLLDPLFDAAGNALLIDAGQLQPVWTALYNTPVLSLSNVNNTVVLGSVVGWLVLAFPIFLLARAGVRRYRATLGPRIERSRAVRAVRATKLYNLYRLFQP
jgi:uncharacterized protein (TIGR03546 family)